MCKDVPGKVSVCSAASSHASGTHDACARNDTGTQELYDELSERLVGLTRELLQRSGTGRFPGQSPGCQGADAHAPAQPDVTGAMAAAWYAVPPAIRDALERIDISLWPQEAGPFVPGPRREELLNARALILLALAQLPVAPAAV
ncbi:hypothetical protein [Paraburkholderia tropica]|uniref:hypothetical protein n=1 Tax=Paraburkholderia tropica TaxID=92647 RepID=UPI002AB65571|nr:hypothetical protein [Paraburkholderia tropica]